MYIFNQPQIVGLTVFCFISTAITCFLFAAYFKPKKNYLRPFLFCTLYTIPLLVRYCCSITLENGDSQVFPLMFLAAVIVALWPAALSGFFDADRFDSQFMAYFTNSLNPFLYIVSVVFNIISDRQNYTVPNVIFYNVLYFAGVLAFLPITKKFIMPRLDRIPSIFKKILVIGTPLSQIFPILTNYTRNAVFDSTLYYLVFISFGITFGILGYAIYRYAVITSQKQKLELSMMFEKNKVNYFDSIEDQQQKISKLSHDMSNHLRTIQMLAKESNNPEITDYSEKLLGQYKQTVKNFCQNSVLNSMLLYYSSVANEKGVTHKFEANANQQIKLSQTDIVTIVSNILDNAFEACENVDESERKISLIINCDENAFTCVCNNSFDGQVIKKGKKFVTQKTDSDNHGLGTQIVMETVTRLGGKCDFSYNEKVFTVAVYIPF